MSLTKKVFSQFQRLDSANLNEMQDFISTDVLGVLRGFFSKSNLTCIGDGLKIYYSPVLGPRISAGYCVFEGNILARLVNDVSIPFTPGTNLFYQTKVVAKLKETITEESQSIAIFNSTTQTFNNATNVIKRFYEVEIKFYNLASTNSTEAGLFSHRTEIFGSDNVAGEYTIAILTSFYNSATDNGKAWFDTRYTTDLIGINESNINYETLESSTNYDLKSSIVKKKVESSGEFNECFFGGSINFSTAEFLSSLLKDTNNELYDVFLGATFELPIVKRVYMTGYNFTAREFEQPIYGIFTIRNKAGTVKSEKCWQTGTFFSASRKKVGLVKKVNSTTMEFYAVKNNIWNVNKITSATIATGTGVGPIFTQFDGITLPKLYSSIKCRYDIFWDFSISRLNATWDYFVTQIYSFTSETNLGQIYFNIAKEYFSENQTIIDTNLLNITYGNTFTSNGFTELNSGTFESSNDWVVKYFNGTAFTEAQYSFQKLDSTDDVYMTLFIQQFDLGDN